MSSGAVSEAVARVEAELGAFWSDAPEGAAKVRASTMNLVVVATPADLERQRATVEALSQTRAGRTFLLTVDGRLAPWEITSDVGAVCRKEGGDVLCYDRIELAFGAMAAARAPSVVGTLSLPEVPTVVCAASRAPSTLVEPLAASCGRLIVDSAHTSIVRIAELGSKIKAPIADLAFVRTFGWREVVARLFDDHPEALRAVHRVTIGRTEGGKNDAAALLLGWLASRLGWTFTSKAAALAPGPAGDPSAAIRVAIELTGDARPGVGPGELTSIALFAERDGAPLEVRCERAAAPGAVECRSRWGGEPSEAAGPPQRGQGPCTVESHQTLGHHDETWVLLKAIDATEGDRVYRAAVLAAAAWESAR